MTQKEFADIANDIRVKAAETAGRFGYARDDAEDIAQDVMLKLWCLHGLVNDAAHLRASAVIMTKRVCIDKWRTMHKYREIVESAPVIDEDTLHDPIEYRDLEHWLYRQIDNLPPTSGMILRMRQLEHRELEEIAGILGIRQSSVSTLLSRARRELFNKLQRRNRQ